ncbi:hypothetical protein ACVBEQ_26935 [Nakamurella sp. GG22]
MRRHRMVGAAVAAALLLISGCGSDTAGERRTVTAVVTVSSGAPGSGASGAPASGSSAAGSATASSSAPVSSAPSSTKPAPFKKVDPLKVDCAAILSPGDVKKIFKTDIPNDRLKITVAELNTDAGQTGRIRCLYGLSGDKKSGAFSMALTKYTDAAAAQAQVDVTVQNETDNNAKISEVTVSGYPATVAIRDGGLIIMPYDDWTLAIATSAKVSPAALEKGLPVLAEAALARVLKG